MINFRTWIPDSDFHSPAHLDLFISSDASICSTMVFPVVPHIKTNGGLTEITEQINQQISEI